MKAASESAENWWTVSEDGPWGTDPLSEILLQSPKGSCHPSDEKVMPSTMRLFLFICHILLVTSFISRLLTRSFHLFRPLLLPFFCHSDLSCCNWEKNETTVKRSSAYFLSIVCLTMQKKEGQWDFLRNENVCELSRNSVLAKLWTVHFLETIWISTWKDLVFLRQGSWPLQPVYQNHSVAWIDIQVYSKNWNDIRM